MWGCLRKFMYKLSGIEAKLMLFYVFCCVLARKTVVKGR